MTVVKVSSPAQYVMREDELKVKLGSRLLMPSASWSRMSSRNVFLRASVQYLRRSPSCSFRLSTVSVALVTRACAKMACREGISCSDGAVRSRLEQERASAPKRSLQRGSSDLPPIDQTQLELCSDGWAGITGNAAALYSAALVDFSLFWIPLM